MQEITEARLTGELEEACEANRRAQEQLEDYAAARHVEQQQASDHVIIPCF
jgi:hypothetical protein